MTERRPSDTFARVGMSQTASPPGLKIAKRTRIAPFIAMDVLAAATERAAAGQDVIHLEVGEPGGGPPAAVLEAAGRALGRIPLGYTEALGRPALRRAIARHYRTTYDLEVDPAQVIVTVGASGAFVLSFLAAFDPGDRVVVPEPAFPAYKNILRALGVEPVRLGLGPETGFALTVEQLAAVAPPVHGLVIASPANPTGTMLGPGQLAGLAGYCRARGIRLIADEIYHGITYAAPAASVLAFDRDAVVINGFSKYFCMTGWRLGWLVAPPDLVRPIELLAQNLFISAPALAQEAALCCVRLRRRACGADRGLPAQPGGAARASARGRPDPAGAGRRRLLPLRRRRPPDRRLGGLVRGPARGDRGGAHARRRLRQRGWPPVRPPRLRGHPRARECGRRPPGGVAPGGRLGPAAPARPRALLLARGSLVLVDEPAPPAPARACGLRVDHGRRRHRDLGLLRGLPATVDRDGPPPPPGWTGRWCGGRLARRLGRRDRQVGHPGRDGGRGAAGRAVRRRVRGCPVRGSGGECRHRSRPSLARSRPPARPAPARPRPGPRSA